MVPFFAYATVFLIIPTLVVVVGAFLSGGRPTLGNVRALTEPAVIAATQHSIILSAVTALAYVILVLPYAYRSLDAGLRSIDVKTLAEASRSLGAGWGTVMVRIVLPNLRTAVLSASFLSVALVLGEFTIANLFSRKNLQVAMYELGKSDAQISIAVGLAALVFGFLVLFAMSFVGGPRGTTSALVPRPRGRGKESA